MLVAGIALLAFVVSQTDLREAWARLLELGWLGALGVLLIYVAGFVVLTASWLVTLPSAQPTPRWLYRLWKVLMVGSALDTVTPLAGLGGEPVKAGLLKRQYGVDYREGAASLVLIRMTDLVAQILFISIGFGLMFGEELLPPAYRWAAAGGLVVFWPRGPDLLSRPEATGLLVGPSTARRALGSTPTRCSGRAGSRGPARC